MSNITVTDCIAAKPLGEEFIHFKVLAYVIVLIMSLGGNIIVLTVVYNTLAMRTVTNLLICNAALSDLIITIFPVTWEIVDNLKFKGIWPLGKFMCVFMYMSIYLSVASTIISLVVMSLDRYCAVMLPYKKYLTVKSLKIVIPVIWMLSFAFASPTIYIQRVVHFEDFGYACVEKWSKPFSESNSPKHYTIILFICLYAVPLLLMSVLYATMATKLMQPVGSSVPKSKTPTTHHKNLLKRCFSHDKTGDVSATPTRQSRVVLRSDTMKQCERMKRKQRVIKMLVCIVIVFAICWLPVNCIQFITFFNPYVVRCPQSIPDWSIFLAFLLQYANSAINPLLYFGFSHTYRNGFKRTFSFLFSAKNQKTRSRPESFALFSRRRKGVEFSYEKFEKRTSTIAITNRTSKYENAMGKS